MAAARGGGCDCGDPLGDAVVVVGAAEHSGDGWHSDAVAGPGAISRALDSLMTAYGQVIRYVGVL